MKILTPDEAAAVRRDLSYQIQREVLAAESLAEIARLHALAASVRDMEHTLAAERRLSARIRSLALPLLAALSLALAGAALSAAAMPCRNDCGG